MAATIDAVFENGVFRPVVPLNLPEGQQVQVIVDTASTAKSGILGPLEDSRKAEEMSAEELEACFDELSAGPELPILPESAYTREGIYEGG